MIEALRENFDCSVASAQTFFPRQDGRRESRRPPGQVPWYTFLGASAVIVGIWLLGVVFYVFWPGALVTRDEKHAPSPSPAPLVVPFVGGARRILGPGQWPRRPLVPPPQPRGLACNVGLDSNPTSTVTTFLLVEHLAVYEVVVSNEVERGASRAHNASFKVPLAMPADAVERCLARFPEFHSAGLAGISLECLPPSPLARRRRCVAVILGALGDRVLRCPLPAIGSKDPPLPTVVSLSPGRWSALAAAGSYAQWWGLPVAVTLQGATASTALLGNAGAWPLRVRAGPRVGSLVMAASQGGTRAAEEAPDGVLGAVRNIRALQSYEDNKLLALSDDGRVLLAWDATWEQSSSKSTEQQPSAQARSLGSWRLPPPPGDNQLVGRRWEALCAVGADLYLAANAEVWRFDLPVPIMAAVVR